MIVGVPSTQQALGPLEPVVERSRPVLAAAARALRGLGRLLQVASLAGVAGTVLLTLGLVRVAGWWGLLGLATGVLPWRGWLVGHHAVAGGGLLADPGRVAVAARSAAGHGRQWLDHVSGLGSAARARRFGALLGSVMGAGRSMWRVASPDVEGVAALRELAIWPKTIAGLGAALACPLLLLIGLVAAAASLL